MKNPGFVLALIVLIVCIVLMLTSKLAIWPLGLLLSILAVARLT